MCPQLNLLNKHGLLTSIRTLIQHNLSNSYESSHELKLKISHSPIMYRLETILSIYPPSGFKEPASFIGAVCSDLANHGLIKHSMKICPITHTFNDAFKI